MDGLPFYLPCDCSYAAMTAIRLLFACYSPADHERQSNSTATEQQVDDESRISETEPENRPFSRLKRK
ncbi:hypothetical protein Y032_0757g2092 [Ancylostoma ceylanicum]|nr:hypothetical protein Y032_0757g2092 [Ancylostoma ceylanicum]